MFKIVEVSPKSTEELSPGTRLCAYWSQQYRCLYPGSVAEPGTPNPQLDTKFVSVEFDDGDSGRIAIEDIRLLPADYPIMEYDPNPLLSLSKRKRRTSTSNNSMDDTHMPNAEEQCENAAIAPTAEERRERKKQKKHKREKERGSDETRKKRRKHKYDENHKKHKKNKKRHHSNSSENDVHTTTNPEEFPPEDNNGNEVDNIVEPALEQSSSSSSNTSSSNDDSLESKNDDPPESNNANLPESYENQEECEEEKERTEDITNGNLCHSEAPQEEEESAENEESDDDDEDEAGGNRMGHFRDRQSSCESKMSAFLPAKQLWAWRGPGYKRGKGRLRKTFYKSVQRGKEIIQVTIALQPYIYY